jgi:RNA polymerase sigma-70 factor, ECF subfamily
LTAVANRIPTKSRRDHFQPSTLAQPGGSLYVTNSVHGAARLGRAVTLPSRAPVSAWPGFFYVPRGVFFDGREPRRPLCLSAIVWSVHADASRNPLRVEIPSEPETFQQVYDSHIDYVWRTVCRLGIRGPAVQDVTQDVFLVVHRKLAEFQGRASVKTWLFRIVRRVVRDHRRTRRRKDGHTDGAVNVDQIPAAAESGPEVSAARAEAVRLVYQILDALDEEKREVFVLAELEQWPAPQIARALEINVNTVYSRLRLAREGFNLALARHRARDRWRTT